MKRMLISSFYNTIIDKEDAIPLSTMLEIDKLKEKGILFSICTNRTMEDVLYYNNDYPFIDYIIAYNGSIVYDVKQKKYLYESFIKTSIINKINSIFKCKEITYFKHKDKIVKIEIKIKKSEIYLIDLLKGLEVNKSLFIINKEIFIEIAPTNTYESIKRLAKILIISNDEIISIIGNQSEKDLIENIEDTYVVSNATNELKKNSNKRTKSNNCKGVENIIKKYNK